ncbi:HpcH/HpaI aldolase/citrate lyase family protein [Muricoccus pecuniae]|uniref:Citrate lyase subunit beta/citryl-CoA lyase n=1 Tax=Muricoccus pecuniae TaxID=693023 RepID=A0A840YMI1_9PROT|nr:CoA ester lyase [Roseomonas pecuniae]MBB5696233.1 citrate lyase subunit beta/citryl-CoA lyase [Roseomonas pecuniae]
MIAPRSFLFVPGDSERKMAKAEGTAAHAIVLDLEDAVATEHLAAARELVREYLLSRRDRSRQQIWVRINPIESDKALADLARVVAGTPDGLLLPKCGSGQDIARLHHYLTALEIREGVPKGAIHIVAVATETPGSLFEFGTYRGASGRLHGLTWGAEDLSTAVGATTNKGDDGAYGFTYQMARSLCLLGAKAAGVHAIDSILPNFRDAGALAQEVRRARQDGFNAKFAIHPDQVAVINAGFRPDADEIARAREIVAAFEASGGVGAFQVRGLMMDRPHLTQALAILESAEPESSADAGRPRELAR